MPLSYQVFVSGIADLPGANCAIRAGASICTCAIDVSATALRRMAQYCNESTGVVLMDSGAYREFSRSERLNWDKVLRRYREFAGLLSRQARAKAWFVAPDKIADPVETARRQSAYGKECRLLQDAGSRIVVPVQFSPEQIADEAAFLEFCKEQWRASLRRLGLTHAVLGFPARMVNPNPLLLRALSKSLPGLDSIHLLGCAQHKLLSEYAECSRVPVSGDANVLRRFITEDLAEQCRNISEERSLDGAVDGDDTEWIHDLYNSPGYLDREQSDLLSEMLRRDPEEVYAAAQTAGVEYGCELGSLLDAEGFDHWSWSFVRRLAERFPFRYALAREELLSARLAGDRARRERTPIQLSIFAA